MEIIGYSIIVALACLAIGVSVRLTLLRGDLKKMTRDMDEIMREDTNRLLTVASDDPAAKRFAASLNTHLRAVRNERRKLQNGDAELKRAVTNISHDLRTPLTAISGHLDLLEKEETSPEVERHLGIIRERTNSLCSLTEELFRYSVITATSDELKAETLRLNGALEESLAAYYGALVERHITPEVTITKTTLIRQLDRDALQRVFGNVLSNAVKYSAGDLAVTLDASGTVTFSNHAPNLTAVDAARLFDRFYTVENARNATGLGLAIAKQLTEKMGGTITSVYENGVLTISLML